MPSFYHFSRPKQNKGLNEQSQKISRIFRQKDKSRNACPRLVLFLSSHSDRVQERPRVWQKGPLTNADGTQCHWDGASGQPKPLTRHICPSGGGSPLPALLSCFIFFWDQFRIICVVKFICRF